MPPGDWSYFGWSEQQSMYFSYPRSSSDFPILFCHFSLLWLVNVESHVIHEAVLRILFNFYFFASSTPNTLCVDFCLSDYQSLAFFLSPTNLLHLCCRTHFDVSLITMMFSAVVCHWPCEPLFHPSHHQSLGLCVSSRTVECLDVHVELYSALYYTYTVFDEPFVIEGYNWWLLLIRHWLYWNFRWQNIWKAYRTLHC